MAHCKVTSVITYAVNCVKNHLYFFLSSALHSACNYLNTAKNLLCIYARSLRISLSGLTTCSEFTVESAFIYAFSFYFFKKKQEMKYISNSTGNFPLALAKISLGHIS